MPQRLWSEDDNATLKRLAGQTKAVQIADQLGRSLGATLMQASKLGISLRLRMQDRGADQDRRVDLDEKQSTQEGPAA